MAFVALLAAACSSPNVKETSSEPSSASEDPQANAEAVSQQDRILGKWVCLADNVHSRPKATMEFRADRTVVIEDRNDKPQSMTLRYRTESSSEWSARRARGEPQTAEALQSAGWFPRGSLMVEFADPKTGEFIDWGGMLLLFDPNSQTLSNPLTQLWCRPGDEERIREASGMNARVKRMEARTERIKAWRPNKDMTGRWKLLWRAKVEDQERRTFDAVAGDLDQDGSDEVVTSTKTGFSILSNRGKLIREVKTDDSPDRYLAIGRRDGHGVIAQFGRWGHSVKGYDRDGRALWTFEPPEMKGINWLAPMQVDTHNAGFVIGYNGGDLEYLGPDGKSRWRAPVDTNVWNVASGRLKMGASSYAICVAPEGAMAYSVAGKPVKAFRAGEVGAVGAGDLDGDEFDEVITLGTTVSSGQNLTAFDAGGKQRWSRKTEDLDVAFLDDPIVFGLFGDRRLLGVSTSMTISFYRGDGALEGTFLSRDGIQGLDVVKGIGKGDALLIRVPGEVRCYELK